MGNSMQRGLLAEVRLCPKPTSNAYHGRRGGQETRMSDIVWKSFVVRPLPFLDARWTSREQRGYMDLELKQVLYVRLT